MVRTVSSVYRTAWIPDRIGPGQVHHRSGMQKSLRILRPMRRLTSHGSMQPSILHYTTKESRTTSSVVVPSSQCGHSNLKPNISLVSLASSIGAELVLGRVFKLEDSIETHRDVSGANRLGTRGVRVLTVRTSWVKVGKESS